jgi:hypothetical protein
MKKIIEFTKNWKHRDFLHFAGGMLIALIPNLLLSNLLGLLIGCWLCALIGHLWEMEQVKNYKAKYSKTDILLSVLGGFALGLILMLT